MSNEYMEIKVEPRLILTVKLKINRGNNTN